VGLPLSRVVLATLCLQHWQKADIRVRSVINLTTATVEIFSDVATPWSVILTVALYMLLGLLTCMFVDPHRPRFRTSVTINYAVYNIGDWCSGEVAQKPPTCTGRVFSCVCLFVCPCSKKVSPRERRDDMPPPMAVRRRHIVSPPIRPSVSVHGSKNRCGSTSVRGPIRSPHISDGRRWLSCRQPACL